MSRFYIQRCRDERGVVPAGMPVVVAMAILVLGVLVAIAVPAFLAQHEKAYDVGAKATARAAALALDTWAIDHPDGYDRASLAVATLRDDPPQGSAFSLAYTSASGYEFTVESRSGNTFTVERAVDGAMSFGCSPVGDAGCPSTGRWD